MSPDHLVTLIVGTHLALVLFVIFGVPLVLVGGWRGWGWVRRPVWRLVHLGTMLVVVGESLLGITCPLTTWENMARARAGAAGYGESFIAHYMHSLMFFSAPPMVFTVVYTAFAGLIVLTWVKYPPRWRPSR